MSRIVLHTISYKIYFEKSVIIVIFKLGRKMCEKKVLLKYIMKRSPVASNRSKTTEADALIRLMPRWYSRLTTSYLEVGLSRKKKLLLITITALSYLSLPPSTPLSPRLIPPPSSFPFRVSTNGKKHVGQVSPFLYRL